MKNYWSLKLDSVLFLSIFMIFPITSSYGQLEEDLEFKESYYLFPIKPGVRNSLSGTMGELRSSHFHSGLDIRTEGRTGLPVYASANGYISRISVSTSGYGNAAYIMHPNGHTTVYAHLDKFTGAIAEYIRKEQYKRKTFELNLQLKKDQFQVTKGDIIALAGNSGSSGGPHLHFDVRDINQNPLNPLKYGFTEILDRTPPEAQKLALITLEKDARINGQFGRFEYTPRRLGNDYIIDVPIEVNGTIGVELYAYDKLDNSRFRCGINLITMDVGDEQVFKQEINTFSFAEQRNILRHMNYAGLHSSGEKFNKLYVDDGNDLTFYTTNTNKGKIKITSDDEQPVKIAMNDSYNNVSYLSFTLKKGEGKKSKLATYGHLSKLEVDLIDNTLVIKTPIAENQSATLFIPQMQEIKPSYLLNNKIAVYLWDMRKGLPHSVDINGKNELLHYKEMIPADGPYKYYNEKLDLYFPKHSLFDTLYLTSRYEHIEQTDTEQFFIGDEHIPLRKNISVTLKPLIYKDPNKHSVYAFDSHGNIYYKGGKWEYGRISFSTRNFGAFTILPDTIPPKIVPLVVNSKELKFRISDERSGIDKIQCYVNNEWVLMNYDYKTQLIWSEKLNDKMLFSGNVTLIVSDNQGNENEYNSKL